MPPESIVSSITCPDLSYLVFDPLCESAVEADVTKEEPLSEENLREYLKKQLEFCFSRWERIYHYRNVYVEKYFTFGVNNVTFNNNVTSYFL